MGKLVLHVLKAIKFAKIKYNVVDMAQNRLILPVDNFYNCSNRMPASIAWIYSQQVNTY